MRIKNFHKVVILTLVLACLNYAQIKLTLPSVADTIGKEIFAPVVINDVSEKNIASYQFQINYDPANIKIIDTSVKGTLSEKSSTTNFIDTKNGVIRIAWAISEKISGEGTLLNLKIKLIHSGETKLTYEKTGIYPNGGIFTSIIGAGDFKVETVNGEIICMDKKKKK